MYCQILYDVQDYSKWLSGVLTTCHTQYTSDSSICSFYLMEQHSQFLLHTLQVLYMCTVCDSTGLFEMIVGVLTTCHTQYTSDSSICIFLFNRKLRCALYSRYNISVSKTLKNIIFPEEQVAYLKRELNLSDCEKCVHKIIISHTNFWMQKDWRRIVPYARNFKFCWFSRKSLW